MRHRVVEILAILLAVAGWWALYQLATQVRPSEAGVLALFFVLLSLTLSATLVPVAAYLNRRFAPKASSRAPFRFLRHSIMGGLCLTSWAWLQMHRAFNLGFAFIIALIFVSIELFLLRLRPGS
jgi:hypothetical protein